MNAYMLNIIEAYYFEQMIENIFMCNILFIVKTAMSSLYLEENVMYKFLKIKIP